MTKNRYFSQIAENTKDIKVGALIALIVPEGEDWTSVELPSDAGSTSSTESDAAKSSTKVSSGTGELVQ